MATLGSSVLAGYSRRMPFAVPPGYFAGTTATFVEGVQAADAGSDPVLSGLQRRMPFAVPPNYFETLPEELLEAAIGASLPRLEPVFSAPPAGYFEALPASILAAAKAADAPRVLPLPAPARRTQTIALPALRWAAAAVLVLGIGLGLYRANTPATVPVTTQRALASLPKQDLQAYVLQNIDDFDTDLLSETGTKATPATPLSRDEIRAYLADDANLL